MKEIDEEEIDGEDRSTVRDRPIDYEIDLSTTR